MQLLVKNQKKYLNLLKKIKYLVVGLITLFIYYVLLYVLKDLIGFNYVVAILISYLFAVISHFLLNRKFTFKLKSKITSSQIFKYFLIALFNYIIQIITLFLLYDLLNFYFYFSWIIGILLTIVIGYTLIEKFIFKEPIYDNC